MKILRRLVKISRRLVEKTLDPFSTKSWIVVTNLDFVDLRRSISPSAFVKIFRIFQGDNSGRIFSCSNIHFAHKNIKRNCRDPDGRPAIPFDSAISLGYYCTTLGGMTLYSCMKGSSKYSFAVLPLL